MKELALIGAGFLIGAGSSWLNSFLTELYLKKLFFSPKTPKWLGSLFGLFFTAKLFILFAFCYAVIRFLGLSLWGVIGGILAHQTLRLIYKAYIWYARSKSVS